MGFGKMNTFINIVEKQKVLDEEGFSTMTDVIVASVRATGKVGTALSSGPIAAPSLMPPTCSASVLFPD